MINIELDEWELQQLQILIAKALINQDYTMGSEVLIAYNKAMKRLLRKLVESEEFAEPEEPDQEAEEQAADVDSEPITIGNQPQPHQNFTNSFDSYLDKKKRQT